MRYGFGIDIGGTTVKLAFFDEAGAMLDAWQIPTVTADGGSHILPDIAAAVKAFLVGKPALPLLGIGLGVPGPVDAHGIVRGCVNLGWGTLDAAGELSRLTGLPVKVDNDANVAALGEYWKGGGKGCQSMVMATLGTGVGGGIVVGGRLLSGAHGAGGEIGHLPMNRQETERCGCGKRGCAEQYCSATGLVRLARRHMAAVSKDSPLRAVKNLEARNIFDAGKAGDTLALEILEQYYAYLGEFLAALCCVLDPEIVVLGGGVSKAGNVLLEGIRPYFERFVFPGAAGCRFAIAALGNDAGAYGAFKLILDAFG